MQTKKISINLIKENSENPRYIKQDAFKKLVQSIKDFPEMLEKRPIVIDENNMILGGNMRLRACQDAGLTEVPVSKAEGWSEEKKKEFIIKDNLGYGEWDWEKLGNSWEKEQLEEWGVIDKNWDKDENFTDKNKEIDINDLGKNLNCICPKCGFEFTKEIEKNDISI